MGGTALLERGRLGVVRSLIVTAAVVLMMMCAAGALADEFRAFWVDAWHAGFLNQGQVDKLLGVPGDPNSIGDIRRVNFNAVIVQVRRRADTCYPSGVGEPYFSSGLSPSNFNALQAMIRAAHDTTGGKQRIEVHCWIVAFATAGGTVYSRHNNAGDLDNYWVTLDAAGNETSDKAFDPGHPKCQEYTVNVAMDLVNRFDIDGIHYDYIRFTGNNQGYNPVSVARYNARYGTTGNPASTEERFKQWRRDQVTSVVRKVYAKIQSSKPWVKQSGSFVTWNPSPASSTRAGFQATRPYYDVYSDWDSWMQEGIVDMAVPMTYYNWASLPSDYTKWMNFEKDRKANRHMVVGPGTYMNSQANAISELLMTRNASPAGNYAQGFSAYNYYTPYSGGTWTSAWEDDLRTQVTPTRAEIPVMPWKVSPSKGHISGTVTMAETGAWADGATARITGPESKTQICDGTGFYSFIDLAPGSYTVTATLGAYPVATKQVAVAIGSVTGNMYVTDLPIGGTQPPVISNVQSVVTNSSATITWDTDQPATSQIEFGPSPSYGALSAKDTTEVTQHSMTLNGLTPGMTYHYRVKSGNDNGESASGDYVFTVLGPPVITNARTSVIGANTATVTWDTNVPADSRVLYGLTDAYGTAATGTASVTSHSVTLVGLAPSTLYHYKCVSTNAYGTGLTFDLEFRSAAPVTEIVIDNTDPGWANTSPGGNTWSTGTNALVPKIGANYLYYAGSGSTVEGSTTRKCTWTPTLTTTGLYDVYVYYQMGTNRNTAAPYTVHYAGGQITSVQNQRADTANQGGWFLVGENLPFAAGNSGYVELTTLTTDTAFVSADAAKFVLKSVPDVTPPVMASVTDETFTTSATSLLGSWRAEDAESGITRYEFAVGSTSGGTDIRGWTSAGSATSATIGGLSLTIGSTYFITARAVNGEGLTSAPRSSAGVRIARSVASVQEAKGLADGEPVALPALVVTARFPERLYAESTDRAGGIGVLGAVADVGKSVAVMGAMGTVDGERVMSQAVVRELGWAAIPSPFYLNYNAVGGGPLGLQAAVQDYRLVKNPVTNVYERKLATYGGASNVGLLVRTTGRVINVGERFFYLDGAASFDDGNVVVKGIKVDWPFLSSTAPSEGDFVEMDCISSCTVKDGIVVRLLRPISAEAIRVVD